MLDLRSLAPSTYLRPAGSIDPSLRSVEPHGWPGRQSGDLELEGVRVDISPAARAYARQHGLKSAQASQPQVGGYSELTPEEEEIVRRMGEEERRVRAHEQAHISAGGSLVRGGANYSYRSGPDGKRYVVSGEVNIDVSPVRDDPAATVRKAYRIRAAALAPADPSPQDRSVAASADQMAAEARAEQAAAGVSS